MDEKQRKPDDFQPPEDIRRFCEALMSEEVKGSKTKAQDLTHVDRGRFYYFWSKSPHKFEFRRWFTDHCDDILGINEAIPPYALMSEVIKGNVEAIKTYYKLRGKLRENPLIDQSQHTHITYAYIRNADAVKEGSNAPTPLQTR